MTDVPIRADWSGELSKAFLQTSEWVRQLPQEQQLSTQNLLNEVETIMSARPSPMSPHRLAEWWSGSRTEATWSLLHQAQLDLLGIAPLTLMQQLLEVVLEHCQDLAANDTARIQLVNFISQRMQGPLREEDIQRGRQ
jgi:hypothetical protein